jgi:pimeloyl-ACP methyl ester carboxylesterase
VWRPPSPANADIISQAEAQIETTFHPVRWALIVALAIPALLVLAFLVAKTVGHDALAHAIRTARIVVGLELIALLLLATLGVLYEQQAEGRDRELYPAPGRLVDVGGYRLHLDCAGKGATVVLEYGHQGSFLDWYRVQPQIAKFARVCLYDRGGYGWSDTSPKPRLPSVMAEELHALLHAAGEMPPYILVGHSFGGLNALMFAHKFPDEVAGVALVDASLPEMMTLLRWRDRVRLRLMQAAIPFGLPRWRGWCGGAAPHEIRRLKQAISCRSSLYGIYYREWSSFPQSAAEIRPITNIGSIPLIVITRDPGVARNSRRDAQWCRLQQERTKLSSNSEFVVAGGSGHDVPMERPDVVTAAIKKLIDTHTRSSQPHHPY